MQVLSGDARRAVFAPLDDGALRSEAVVRRVGSAIALGLLGDGEQLPAETELATMLNVSTVTLRDALAELRELGLVETRRGRGGGSFVRARDDALAELADARLAELGTTDLRELGDAHGAVAATAARLAAGRASVHEIARLREIVDRLAARADDDGAAPRRRPVLRGDGRRGPLGAADDAGDGAAPGARAAAVAAGARAGAAGRDRRRPPRRPRRRRAPGRRAGPRPHRASTSTGGPSGRSTCTSSGCGTRRRRGDPVRRRRPRDDRSDGTPAGSPRWSPPRSSGCSPAWPTCTTRRWPRWAPVRAGARRRGGPGGARAGAPGRAGPAGGRSRAGRRPPPGPATSGCCGGRPTRSAAGSRRCGRTCARPASTSTTTRRPSGSTSPGGPGGGTSSVPTSTCTARGATC